MMHSSHSMYSSRSMHSCLPHYSAVHDDPAVHWIARYASEARMRLRLMHKLQEMYLRKFVLFVVALKD